jgi:hypothetical protein
MKDPEKLEALRWLKEDKVEFKLLCKRKRLKKPSGGAKR